MGHGLIDIVKLYYILVHGIKPYIKQWITFVTSNIIAFFSICTGSTNNNIITTKCIHNKVHNTTRSENQTIVNVSDTSKNNEWLKANRLRVFHNEAGKILKLILSSMLLL